RLLHLLTHGRRAADPDEPAFVHHFWRDGRRVFARVRDCAAEAERREPRRPNERARIAPQRPGLLIRIGDDDIAQDADFLTRPQPAPGRVRLLVVNPEQKLLERGIDWRQNRLNTVSRAPANGRFAEAEWLHDRWMWLLQW